MLNARLRRDDQADSTTGEAIAGMSLNGLGFSDRPMSLTPQFFANTPGGVLLRTGVSAEPVNRFQRGRSLDKAFSSGGDLWCSAVALAGCQREGIELTCTGLDTTSFSRTGAYGPETDTQAMALPYGDSKEHRPDVTPAGLALMVAQEGGVPFMSQRWDGQASDTVGFKARCEALSAPCEASEPPRSLSADAKLDTEAHAPHWASRPLMTRMPET